MTRRELQCYRAGMFCAARMARPLQDEIEEQKRGHARALRLGADSTECPSDENLSWASEGVRLYRERIRQRAAELLKR